MKTKPKLRFTPRPTNYNGHKHRWQLVEKRVGGRTILLHVCVDGHQPIAKAFDLI